MTEHKKNPYSSETPEWQLWENMNGAEALQIAHMFDAARYTKLAADARCKADLYRAALEKLSAKEE